MDDKPTESNTPPNQAFDQLVGTWQRTITKADGVIITPDNDQWNVYDEDVITLKSDSTGLVTDKYGSYAVLKWYADGGYLNVTLEGIGEVGMSYILQGDTLSTFFPGGGTNPDLEYIYTRL